MTQKTDKPSGDKPAGRKRFYITNDVMLPEVKRAKELGYVTNELGKMFMLITERFARHPSFSGYTFREDMVGFALANLCANGLKFDTEKFDNPFNYYTTAIYHSFLQYLADEKKQRNIRDLLLIEHGANPSSTMVDAAHDDFTERHYGDGSDANTSNNSTAGTNITSGPDREDAVKKNRNYGIGGKTKARINAKKAEDAAAAGVITPVAEPKTASVLEY